jgi:hypothetical protein
MGMAVKAGIGDLIVESMKETAETIKNAIK